MSIQEIMSRMNSRKTVTSAVTAKEAAVLILKVAKKHFTGRKVYVDARFANKIELRVTYDHEDLIIEFNLETDVKNPAVWIGHVAEPVFDFPGADDAGIITETELKTGDVPRLVKVLMKRKPYYAKVLEDYSKYIDSFSGFMTEINSLVTE